MKKEYKEEIEKIHAPKELVIRTKQAMIEELAKENKKSNIYLILKKTAPIVLVAALMIIVGLNYFQPKDQISISIRKDTEFSVGNHFGKKDPLENNDNIKQTKGKESSVIPSFVKEAEVSRINGVKVQIVKEKKNSYHAGFQKKGTYFYIVGKGVSEQEFIKELKKII